MITLGIETSCDETALALIETRQTEINFLENSFECRVINSLVHSQADLHSAYGGVYPSLAKREHGKNLVPLLDKLLNGLPSQNKVSNESWKNSLQSFQKEIASQNPELFESFRQAEFIKNIPQIDRIAVTEGPGLEPALWVGINFARMLANVWQIPLIPVNHMEGHVVGSLLESDKPMGTWQRLKPLEFPALALLISGGHTELVKIDQVKADWTKDRMGSKDSWRLEYKILGQTKDDAVGEAFDKVARLLDLPYPGGPHVSRLAKEAGDELLVSPIKLPRPMIHSGDLDFSFSGLKTAVLYTVRDNAGPDGKLTEDFKKALAGEFEAAVIETLNAKLRQALELTRARTIIIGGGVSANEALRQKFTGTAAEFGVPLYLPSRHISGDNALMIALAGALDQTQHAASPKACGTKRLGGETSER